MKPSKLIHMTAALAAATVLSQTQIPAQTLDPWQTVDDFQLVPGLPAGAPILGTDATGTVLFGAGMCRTDTANHGSGVICRSADAGQTWATVDVFAPPPGMNMVLYYAFAADPMSGRLYAVGSGVDTSQHWLVRSSADGGDTWQTEEMFQNPGTCQGVAADGAGNVYAGGELAPTTTSSYELWTVRRRDAVSGAWKTVDAFGTKSSPAGAFAMGVHPTAGVFAVGYAYVSGLTQWTVRRSVDGISSWKTVDAFATARGMASCAYGAAVGGAGTVYVVGRAYSNGNQFSNWVVRRTTNGGLSWSTVDTFRYNNGPNSWANAVTVDATGAVWVAGVGYLSSTGPYHWLVRKGTTNPATGAMAWKTSDDFPPVAGHGTIARGITRDAAGNLFVGGNAPDASGTAHWTVRKLATP